MSQDSLLDVVHQNIAKDPIMLKVLCRQMKCSRNKILTALQGQPITTKELMDLPKDCLVHIISYFSMKDIARMEVAIGDWGNFSSRDVFRECISHPKIKFDCPFEGYVDPDDEPFDINFNAYLWLVARKIHMNTFHLDRYTLDKLSSDNCACLHMVETLYLSEVCGGFADFPGMSDCFPNVKTLKCNSDGWLENFLRVCGNNVTDIEFDLPYCHQSIQSHLDAQVLKHCPNLRRLSFGNSDLEPDLVFPEGQLLSLECLSLSSEQDHASTYSNAALEYMADRVPNLQVLEIVSCRENYQGSLHRFALKCPLLHKLKISDDGRTWTTCEVHLLLQTFLSNCKSLIDLDVVLNHKNIFSSSFAPILKKFGTNLKKLRLRSDVDFGLFFCALRSLPVLEQLTISSGAIYAELFESVLPAGMPSEVQVREFVSIGCIDFRSFNILASMFTKLERLSISSSSEEDNVMDILAVMKTCSMLQRLDVNCTSVYCLPENFGAIFDHPRNSIQEFSMYGCSEIIVSTLVMKCPLLSSLKIGEFSNEGIDGHVISTLATYCVRLKRLTLSGFHYSVQHFDTIRSIILLLPTLRVLELELRASNSNGEFMAACANLRPLPPNLVLVYKAYDKYGNLYSE